MRPLQHTRQKTPLLLLVAEVDNRRSANGVAASQSPDDAQVSAARDLVNHDDVVKAVPFARVDVAWKSLAVEIVSGEGKRSYGCVAELCMALVDLFTKYLVKKNSNEDLIPNDLERL